MGKIYILSLVLLFVSCTGDNGSRVIGGELSVYYTEPVKESKAIDLANYWKRKNLLTGKPQDLQVSRLDDRYIVKMIASDPKDAKQMDLQERALLLKLQAELSDSVFAGEILELWICNSQFEQITDINQ